MSLKSFLNKNKDLLLVFLLFLIVISVMQFRVPEIIGYDGWLHTKMAELIKQKGFIKEFPYITESILADNYADMQWLFRVLLVPFTFFGLMTGAKIASVLFSALCFTVFYWYLKKNEISYALFWTALYAISSIELMYRFLEARAMPIAILFLILTLYFIEKEMYKSLFFVSLLFTWLYPGFVLQLVILIVYFIIVLLINKRINLKLLIYPLLGILLALIVNPYFPKNISFLYIQLFKVNLLGNLYNMEWKPWNIIELFMFNWILFLVLFTGLVYGLIYIIKKKELRKESIFLLIISIFFLVLTIKSRRIQEYFAPFAILFGAFSLNKLNEKKKVKYLLALLIIIIAGFSLVNLDRDIKSNHFLPWYNDGAEWLKANVPKGSTVFINGYMFNYLFFYDSDVRYTHGIDLTYSYLHDKYKFGRYMAVLQGRYPSYNIIKDDYKADYVFAGKLKQDIKLYEYIVKFKDDFEVVYEDESVGILRVR